MKLLPGDALIIVDVQNDFLPGGPVPVRRGDDVIGPLNRYAAEFSRRHLPVFVTRDWHPKDHCSFVGYGGRWPPHCLAGTPGADFVAELRLPHTVETVSKGTYHAEEGISAFDETNLINRLRMNGCRRLFIGGLATDYSVHDTAMDALRAGFDVVILQDAVKPIESRPGDEARALGDIVSLGGQLASLGDLLPGQRAMER
jgi:nicotinamidase-related amidase